MAWLPIVVGIIIGYMIYQKKRLGAESDSYGKESHRYTEEADAYIYRTRSVQNNQPQITCPADEHREINEAVAAGERALDSLKTAKSKLDSARAWGIYDILGGGLISSESPSCPLLHINKCPG